MNPLQALEAFQKLIDFCVNKGGVFKSVKDASIYQHAVDVLNEEVQKNIQPIKQMEVVK